LTVQVERFRQRRHQLLGHLAGAYLIGVLADHDELVAAEPRDRVVYPYGCRQPLCDQDE
jgi:hypothetical protein